MENKKIPSTVFDPVSENLQRLLSLFPSIIKDGQIDVEALKAELGIFEETGKERYELTWAGKQDAKKIATEGVYGRTLKFVPEDNKNPETTENLYIEGDNLEVLKLLQNSYMGKIKMIYIDPPYNTGVDRLYKDNFSVSEFENAQAEGNIDESGMPYVINTKSSGRYHANWLSMMYPRLRLAKNLLRDDGVIFISIDDNEIHNLRNIMDEIFGEENFVTTIHVEMSATQGMKLKAAKMGNIVKNAEYILVYSKNKNKQIGVHPLFDPADYDTHYSLILKKREDGLYYDTRIIEDCLNYPQIRAELEAIKLIDSLTKKNTLTNNDLPIAYKLSPAFKEYIYENRFTVVSDDKTDGLNIPTEVLEKIRQNVVTEWKHESGKIYLLTKNSQGTIRQRIPISDKINLTDENKPQVTITTIRGDWWGGFYLDMGNVNKEGNIIFYNGKKPIRLIKELIKFVSNSDDDIILDFFSGSATTAHSVMKLNLEDGIKRRFIMVQISENCSSNQESVNSDFKTITDIGKERIRRAGDKILEESGEKGKSLDIGFKVFRTGDTNIRWIAEENGMQVAQTQFDTISRPVKDVRDFMPDATDIDVAYEILLRQYDIPLSSKMEKLTDIGTRTYCFADTVVVCLEEEITGEIVDKIAAIEPLPHKIIFRDSAFGKDIELKVNTLERFDAMMKKHSSKSKQSYTIEFL